MMCGDGSGDGGDGFVGGSGVDGGGVVGGGGWQENTHQNQ